MAIEFNVTNDKEEIVPYNDKNIPLYINSAKISSLLNRTTPSHWHDDIELALVVDGSKQYNINGQIITVAKGDGLFINSRQLHSGFSLEKTDCEYICTLFHPILLCSNKYMEDTFVRPIVSNQALPYKYLSANIPWEREILDSLRMLLNASKHESEPTFHLKAHRVFFRIWEHLYTFNQKLCPVNTKPIGNNNLTSLKEMLAYIHNQYEGKLTLEDIAKAGNMSESSCNTVFREYLHQTPMEYVINYRLNISMDLLKSTNLTITDICHSVGFSGASYFSETFRKHIGCSPSVYRKQTEPTV